MKFDIADGSWKDWRREKRRYKNKIKKYKNGKNANKKKNKIFKEDKKIVFGEEEESYQTVIFIEHTEESTLAKRIREKLRNIEEIGRIKVKIVEI